MNVAKNLVNIKPVDKIYLLKNLWANSSIIDKKNIAPNFDNRLVSYTINKGFINKYCGRTLNIDLSGDIVDPSKYNSINGNGVFEKVLQQSINKKYQNYQCFLCDNNLKIWEIGQLECCNNIICLACLNFEKKKNPFKCPVCKVDQIPVVLMNPLL